MTAWTRARHPDAGEAVLPVDALAHMPYWEAIGNPASTQQELLVQIDQERADAEEAALKRVAEAVEAVEDGVPIPKVLETVAQDPAAAAAALAAEQDKDEPRTTLVHDLEQIADQHTADQPAGDTATTEKD